MSYSIEKIADAPIVIFVHAGQAAADMDEAINAVVATLDAQTAPVFLISDLRGLAVGVDDLTKGANMATRGAGSMMHHRNVRETLLVSDQNLMRLAAQGLSNAAFGNVKVRVFETTEQAVTYCREQVAAEYQARQKRPDSQAG